MHRVFISGLLPWVEPKRLLGPGNWTVDSRSAHGELPTHAAADLDARLRGISIGGSAIAFDAQPALPRAAVRAARTTDARRRRDGSVGFSRPGIRLDEEGRVSLTPEALALALGERFSGRTVVDAGCGAGGNSIGFARAGCRVIAVERDGKRLADARHNAAVYGVTSQIEFVSGEAVAVATRHADPDAVLFVDPPWGVEWDRGGMGLAAFPLLDALLASGVPQRYGSIVVKLPPSFRAGELFWARPEAVYGVGAGDARRVKFLLLVGVGAVSTSATADPAPRPSGTAL